MNVLDCNTERGRQWISQQNRVGLAFAAAFKAQVIFTDDTRDADVDALFFRENSLGAIAEIKARSMSLLQLQNFKSYLITYDKIEKGRMAAVTLRVPYLVIVGLIDRIAYWRMSDSEGKWQTRFDVKQTETQATCNGGIVSRANAFLSLATMRLTDYQEDCQEPIPVSDRNLTQSYLTL